MKGKRIFLTVCVFAMILAIGAGFINFAWAAKPPRFHIEPGYAKFRDAEADMIRSDNENQYMDCYAPIPGEERLLLYITDDTGDLFVVKFFVGRISYFYPEKPPSTRTVNFWLDFPSPNPSVKNAVYDILFQWKDVLGNLQPRSLNDNTIHANMYIHDDEAGISIFEFLVDPGYEGSDPKAITQTTVDAFYSDDTNWDYEDVSQSGEYGQILYRLDFGNNLFEFEPVEYDNAGKPKTWIIKPLGTSSMVRLNVTKNLNRGKKTVIYLADIPNGVPFQLAVSRESLDGFIFPLSSGAPRRNSTLSAVWGDIKAK